MTDTKDAAASKAKLSEIPVRELRSLLISTRAAFAREVERSQGIDSVAELTVSRDRRVLLAELIEQLESRIHAPPHGYLRTGRTVVRCDCPLCLWRPDTGFECGYCGELMPAHADGCEAADSVSRG